MIVEIRDEVVTLSGSLTENHWQTLESAVKVRLRHHPDGIVVDCGGLTSLTAEGADTFRDAAEHISLRGARFVLANVPASVQKTLRQIPNITSQIPMSATVAEARASVGMQAYAPRHVNGIQRTTAKVVVGLLGNGADLHAVSVGLRLLANESETHHLYLAYLLQVPRQMSLQAPLGEEEEAAKYILSMLEPAVRTGGAIPIARVERTRNPAERLVQVAEEMRADTIVLAIHSEAPDETKELILAVLARASCEVVVNRVPASAVTEIEIPAPAATTHEHEEGH